MKVSPKSKRQYADAFRNHVYPPPAGMRIHDVEYEGGRIMVIDIPPQADELRPFLVHGAMVDGKNDRCLLGLQCVMEIGTPRRRPPWCTRR